jgi:hypothetical protein
MNPEDVPSNAPWIDLADGFAVRGTGVKAVVRSPGVARRRRGGGDAVQAPEAIEAAFLGVGMREQHEAELTFDENAPVRRRRRGGEVGLAQVVEIAVEPPPENYEQVILAVSETGVLTWHLADETASTEHRRRRGAGASTRVYRIPVHAWDKEQDGQQRRSRRGLFSAIGRKLIKVLIFPVTDLVLGPLEKFLALKWEEQNAPYVLRAFTPENYKTKMVTPLSGDQWRIMGAGRALLFVHGTFSSAHGAFSLLTPEQLRAFHDRYSGRVFAFNHHTIGHDPRQNIERFCADLPTTAKLDLDIICHSRGGLVSRVLSSSADQFGGDGRIKVSRIAFVAAPNDGTALADTPNIMKMLDRYTNVAQFLPDGPIEVAIELVLTAVKALAHAGLKFLPGLAAQAPDSDFLKWLRSQNPKATQHFALAAEFEPVATEWKALVAETVKDQVMDAVFRQAKNDLVVPTLGVGETAHGLGFPIDPSLRFSFPANAGILHTNFFGNATTVAKLMEWLALP